MEELAYIRRPAALAGIRERTAQLKFAMASEDRTGALLRTLIASKPAGRFLELGTGTGVSAAWILDGMDSEARLLSVDVDPVVQQAAREFLGDDLRLTLVTEDAAEFLKREPSFSFDFVFADAMPGKYEVLDEALRVVNAGGFYVIDDMLPQANWPNDHEPKAAELLRHLSILKNFAIVPMAWSSGLVIATRITTAAVK